MDNRLTQPGRRTPELAAVPDLAHVDLAARREPTAGLAAAASATHAAALAQFAIGTVESEYKAIARLSVHLAAMRRGVYSPRRHQSAAHQELTTACKVAARRLEWALWLLQGRLSGDIAAVRQPGHQIYTQVSECLDSYLAADRALAAWADSQLPAGDRRRLAEGYLRCLARAPSRPHPRSPQGGTGYRVAFTFYCRWDRLLDTVDARPGVGRGFPDPADPAEKSQHHRQGDTQAAA
jgi:hypothetical protein